MASISTGTGLVSGLNIEDIVTKLMAVERRPIDNLNTRIKNITNKKTIFVELAAKMLKLSLDVGPMWGAGNLLKGRTVSSSNESVLTATAQKGAPLGNYTFSVKSLVQAHQMVSNGFADSSATVGAGTITVELGNGSLDRATTLDALNGGAGVPVGSIRVTDRSGRSAEIDLSGATNMRDVLDKINFSSGIGVRASVSGDHMVIADTTGQSASDLIIENVAGGTTATSLGIARRAASTAIEGADIVSVGASTALNLLNDRRGARTTAGMDDFQITRRDGVTINVTLSGAKTVGDVLAAINAAAANADGKLTAAVSADGKGLTLTDSTGAAGSLSVTALNGSGAAEDLGILGTTSGDTIAGRRLLAELNTVLLSSTNGGSGVAAGSIRITNRQGASEVVDLTSAQTLADVIDGINAASLNVTASLNSARTGLVLTDSSGGTGALSVADVDSTTAADLKIDQSVPAGALRGANLQMQYVSNRTLLSSLGGGVYRGQFRITDRAGNSATVDLSQESDDTIGEVISEINSRGVGVVASINATGDGILLTDTSGGTGTLKVTDLDGGTTAADLRLAGSAKEADPTRIDGSLEYRIEVTAADTLSSIASKLKNSGAKISAGVMNDGSSVAPYHLSVISRIPGSTGEMVVDTGNLAIDLSTTQRARDAVLLYGRADAGAPTMRIISTSNKVTGVVEGLTLDLHGISASPVDIAVTSDDKAVIDNMKQFVADWNAIIDKVKDATRFDAESNSAGLLLGDPTVQRIEDALSRMIQYTVPGASPGLSRLSNIGVSFMETGKISFDSAKFENALGGRRDDVEKLFSSEKTGIGSYFKGLIEGFTDAGTGIITRKNDQYDDQIDLFKQQIAGMESRLIKVRDRLYNEFYSMEEVLSRLQSQKTAIDNMQSFLGSSKSR